MAHGAAWLRLDKGAALSLTLPDNRVLVAIGYLPIFVFGAPFDFPPNANYFDALAWSVINHFIGIAGGRQAGSSCTCHHSSVGGRRHLTI